MASIEKRTDKDGNISYRVKIRLKGYPTESASFKRLTDAKRWASSTESAILEGRHFKTREAKKHTLGEAIDKYLDNVLPQKFTSHEQRTRRPILAWWRDTLGHCVLADLDSVKFTEAKDLLLKKPSRKGNTLSPDSIKRYFLSVSHVLKTCAVNWGWLEKSPLDADMMELLELPKLPDGRKRFLDDDERERLLETCKESEQEWLYLAVILAISSGMRQGELLNLHWKEPKTPPKETAWGVIYLDRQAIVLHNTKNGDERRVPLTGLAYQLLKQHAKIRRLDTTLVFPSPKNPQKPISFKRSWMTALKKADIDDFRWHDLRHCTASYLIMNGASLVETAEVLGHKDLQMTQRYAHLSDGHVSSVVESMNAKMFGEQ